MKEPTMNQLYDKKGIPILPGDTLKVFHFVAARRRERRFMYKFVLEIVPRKHGPPLLRISHLQEGLPKEGYYFQLMDGRVMEDIEIVQGYGGVAGGCDFRDRKRKPV